MKKIFIALILIAVIVGAFALTACSGNNVKIEYDPSTTYGVYWYSSDGKYVRSSQDMSKDLFDASKPTFVFAHGWEPDKENSSNGLVEDLVTHPDTIKKTSTEKRNYAEELKEQGYNVALLGWFSYAKNLGDLFRFIWVDFDGGNALSVRFAQELAAVLGEDYEKDVKIVGHSYGSQLALATTYQLTNFKENGLISNQHIIPTRMTLADPYIGSTGLVSDWKNLSKSKISYTNEKIDGRAPKVLFADQIDYVVSANDIAVDIYCGMSMASTSYYKYDTSDASFEKLSKNCAFVKSEGLKRAYGDTSIHNVTRDWVLLSIVDDVLMYEQDSDILAPSGAASDEDIMAMRGKCYYQNYRGFNLSMDSMTLFADRKTEQY
ncbi:MAG: hypothetical protein K2K24_00790 [Clostridia bacterium]|nr:hypothetical protein [Clostridia bacterium]